MNGTNSVDIKSGAVVVTNVRVSSGNGTPAFKATAGSEDSTWCVSLNNPNGSQKDFYYSAAAGLNPGTCP
jgi:hypothetical protein